MINDIEQLKLLASQATPGPWYAVNDEREGDDEEYWVIASDHGNICGDEGFWIQPVKGTNEANAKWIAHANPAIILEIIKENERLRAQLQQQNKGENK